jgi:osmotically-inducible protein OsmY
MVLFQWSGLSVPLESALSGVLGIVCGYLVAASIDARKRKRRDTELTGAVNSVRIQAGMPDTIEIKLHRGQLTLGGRVDSEGDRLAAEQILRTVPEIKRTINQIRLSSPTGRADPDEVRRRIEDTLLHAAELEGQEIHVVMDHSRVILEGKVRSWVAASEAERIAWNIPGIGEVDNRLVIE